VSGRGGGSGVRYREYRRALSAGATEGAQPSSSRRSQPRHRSVRELMRIFWTLLGGVRGTITVALTAITISAALRLIPPAATGFALDHVLGHRRMPDLLGRLGLPTAPGALLLAIAALLVLVAVVSAAIGTWGRYLTALTTRRLQSLLRRQVFARAIRLPLHRLRAYQSGGLASLLREDVGGAAGLLGVMVFQPWRALIQLLGTVVALGFIEWRAVVGAALLLPLVYLPHRLWIRQMRPIWRDIRMLRRRIDAHVTEVFAGIRVIRGFGRQRTEALRDARDRHVNLRQEMLAWWMGTAVEVGWSLLLPLVVAGLVWYGGGRILEDAALVASGALDPARAFTTGNLVSFLFYLAMLLEPLAVLANAASNAQSGLAALDRVLDVLDERPELEGAAGTLALRPEDVAGRFTLRQVSFQYPGRRAPALRDVTLEIPAGHAVALVGPSGAGKSTLCDVIARFHDPTEGVVELDGIDIRKIELQSYRRLIAVVEQDVFLFEGTIRENLAYGARDASPAAIARAAEAALAAPFIEEMDEGYDTLVGERGVRLSGGQRKRLAIARALLTDPRILILDEATSELDAASERLVHRSLATLMRGRTVFIIAHRLSTVAHADLIVLLDRGRVVDRGRHAELLARSAAYRELVEAQLLDLERPVSPGPA
jgi:ATP-binding cassette subfamily B protein/subfamily B ATP-binding cassette protein MsbA